MYKFSFTLFGVIIFTFAFLFSCNESQKKPDAGEPEMKVEYFDSLHRNNQLYLKQDALVNYSKNADTITPNKKLPAPFDTLSYNKIIAYDYEGSEEPYPTTIDRNGKFVPVILKQQSLTQLQADEILSIFTDVATYGGRTAACFNPHFGLLFFKNNRVVNAIDVCLGCNYLKSDIEIPAESHKKVNKGTLNEYAIIGFTKKGKASIRRFCKQLNFQ